MAENDDRLHESDPPSPHGDPLERDIIESNRAQQQSDATPDVVGADMVEDPIEGGSTANGIPANDPADGETRKKLYKEGATLVSRLD